MPVFVVSHDIPEDVPKGATPFTFVTDGIESGIAQATATAGDKNVYVLGGANVYDVFKQWYNVRVVDVGVKLDLSNEKSILAGLEQVSIGSVRFDFFGDWLRLHDLNTPAVSPTV